jgi:ABC-type multidrug transport system ATPase subunit
MDEAEYLCDRVAIIDSGKIIALDTPDKLIDNLVASGFERPKEMKLANLEDVFIHLTGHSLRSIIMSIQNKLKAFMNGKIEAQKTAGAAFMTENISNPV